MNTNYDAIVIGGGHNGLTTACYLARKGRKTIVVESREVLGGLASKTEFHPGFWSAGLLSDTSRISREVVDQLKLADQGLKLTGTPPKVLTIDGSGQGLVLGGGIETTAGAIKTVSDSDSQNYRDFTGFIGSVGKVMDRLTKAPLPDLDNLANNSVWDMLMTGWNLKRLGKKRMADFMSVIPMCLADWLNQWFDSDLVKGGLAGEVWEGMAAGPWSPGTAFNLLLKQHLSGPEIIGGPAALIQALTNTARSLGVEIRTSAPVEEILIRNGRAAGVELPGREKIEAGIVAASCDPRRTFLELIPGPYLNHRLKHRLASYRGTGNTARINLALSVESPFKDDQGQPVEHIRSAPDLDTIEKCFDQSKYGRFAQEPLLDIHVPSVSDPELCPRGAAVMSILVPFVPIDLKGGWNKAKQDELQQAVVSSLEKLQPGLGSKIEGAEVITPVDMEQEYGLVKGHLLHGEPALDQFISRPVPECAQYATPVKNLYLCGSGSHPGGGITGLPGKLAAQAITG